MGEAYAWTYNLRSESFAKTNDRSNPVLAGLAKSWTMLSEKNKLSVAALVDACVEP